MGGVAAASLVGSLMARGVTREALVRALVLEPFPYPLTSSPTLEVSAWVLGLQHHGWVLLHHSPRTPKLIRRRLLQPACSFELWEEKPAVYIVQSSRYQVSHLPRTHLPLLLGMLPSCRIHRGETRHPMKLGSAGSSAVSTEFSTSVGPMGGGAALINGRHARSCGCGSVQVTTDFRKPPDLSPAIAALVERCRVQLQPASNAVWSLFPFCSYPPQDLQLDKSLSARSWKLCRHLLFVRKMGDNSSGDPGRRVRAASHLGAIP